MKTLGIDPGTKNYAMVGLDGRGRAVYAAFLEETIKSAAAANADQIDAYHRAIRRVLKKFGPDRVGAEAFITRGFGTVLTQFVNLMLGVLFTECRLRKIERTHVTSSTWKNNFKPIGDLKALYKIAHAEHRLPPHIIDALCIAVYTRNGEKFTYEDRALIAKNVERIAEILERDDDRVPAHKRRRGKKVQKELHRKDRRAR